MLILDQRVFVLDLWVFGLRFCLCFCQIPETYTMEIMVKQKLLNKHKILVEIVATLLLLISFRPLTAFLAVLKLTRLYLKLFYLLQEY